MLLDTSLSPVILSATLKNGVEIIVFFVEDPIEKETVSCKVTLRTSARLLAGWSLPQTISESHHVGLGIDRA